MDVWKHTDYLGGLKFGRFPSMEVPDRAFGRLGSLEVLRVSKKFGKMEFKFGRFWKLCTKVLECKKQGVSSNCSTETRERKAAAVFGSL